MTKKTLALAILGVGLLALAFLSPAEAQDTDHGWTVWQDGKKTVYPFKDEWIGNPNQAGFSMVNKRRGVTHYYYGTLKVEFRERDAR